MATGSFNSPVAALPMATEKIFRKTGLVHVEDPEAAESPRCPLTNQRKGQNRHAHKPTHAHIHTRVRYLREMWAQKPSFSPERTKPNFDSALTSELASRVI